MAATKDLVIQQGRTFTLVLRWETEPIVYKAISAITQAAPVRISFSVAHGCPDGWRAAVTGVKGMTEINAEANSVKERDFHPVTVIDANTIEFNEVDASGYKAYTSGGFLQYNTPVDLTGYTGRMKIKDKVGGTVLLSTEAGDTPLDVIDIALDTTAKTITLTIAASATDDITWSRGVYDLEMVNSDAEPVVTAILTGKVSVTREVTT